METFSQMSALVSSCDRWRMLRDQIISTQIIFLMAGIFPLKLPCPTQSMTSGGWFGNSTVLLSSWLLGMFAPAVHLMRCASHFWLHRIYEGGRQKANIYWPTEEGSSQKYGIVEVTTARHFCTEHFDTRIFLLRCGTETRKVVHYQYS